MMYNIFNDTQKIKLISQIEKDLCDLRPNANEDEINNIINQIPPQYLTQKDDLMMVCQTFAYYARNNFQTNKGNSIKLFEKIFSPIKEILQDLSSFFWNIFGGLFFFKLWFYNENLISMEQIIQATRFQEAPTVAEYFLPEIIEHEPEIFESEIKKKIHVPYTKEYIDEFVDLRVKYFNWLRNSNDYHDSAYLEIEKDPFRLSIKLDDIDSFQKIFSNLNLKFDMEVSESVLESYLYNPRPIPLLEYIIQYNAFNIFKFVMMNSKIEIDNIFSSICQRNYDLMHIVESQMKEKFVVEGLECSIQSWNHEVTEYILNNYDYYNFLEKSDVEQEKDEIVLRLISDTCFSFNFIFLDSVLIPFLIKNKRFLDDQINDILQNSFHDQSCFFSREFLKHPNVDINYYSPTNTNAITLVAAINQNNAQAVELLFKNPKINYSTPGISKFSPFQWSVGRFVDMKIVKMFTKQPGFNVNQRENVYFVTAFQISTLKMNSYALQFLSDNFNNLEVNDFGELFHFVLKEDNLFILKILLRCYKKFFPEFSKKIIISKFQKLFNDETELGVKFEEVVNEILK